MPSEYLSRIRALWRRSLDGDLRQRSASALTHPTTVAALAVLLLNDLLFKSLWPDSWVTGKLSDLAWVVFASPLLAFLLSLMVGKSSFGHRASFVASYIGLPLLYAAFNTFAPVHDAILRVLLLASGGTSGSPLDATDSLVIPLGLGIALWVWQRWTANTNELRLRLGLLVAGIAALASVATSYPSPDQGIWELGIGEDGAVYGRNRIGLYHPSRYRSVDGGLTWESSSGDPGQIRWSFDIADTPRGRYQTQGAHIVLISADGESKSVYSVSHLRNAGSVWVQEHSTAHLSAREVTVAPRTIVYDEPSGNIIAGMGILGVVVGTPDGRWTQFPVGRYEPVDFSILAKTNLLLSSVAFWATLLAVTISTTGATMIYSQFRGGDFQLVGASILVPLMIVFGSIALVTMGLELLIVPLFGVTLTLGLLSEGSRARKTLGLGLGISAMVAAGGLLFTFGGSDADPGSNYGRHMFIFGFLGFPLGTATLAVSARELRYWRGVLPAFLGMNGLILMAFMLWLHLGIPIALAKASAVILTGLAAVALLGYIRRQQVDSSADAGE